MKCTEFQQNIWLGQQTNEMKAHLQACPVCRAELQTYQSISNTLRNTVTITPSRSLIPDSSIIRQTVKRNRKKPFMKFTTVAASIVLIGGTAIGMAKLGFDNQQSAKGPNERPGVAASNQQNWIDTEPNIPHPELVKAVEDYMYRTYSSEQINHLHIQALVLQAGADSASPHSAIAYITFQAELQPNAKLDLNQGQNQYAVKFDQKNGVWSVSYFDPVHSAAPTSDVVVSVDPNAAKDPILDSIRAYIRKMPEFRTLKSITVESYVPDPNSTSTYQLGQVKVNVDTFPRVEAPLLKGSRTLYVLLTKQQGLWTVEKMDLQPLHATDVPDYAKPFNQAAEKLKGKVKQVELDPVDLANGQKGNMLVYIVLDIEQNLTPAGSWRAGKEIRIDYSEVIPQSSPLHPKVGDEMVISVAHGNAAAAAGQDLLISHLNATFYQQNGKYYDVNGKQVDPTQGTTN